MTHSPDQTLHDIAHMAFCALVALHTAIQDDRVSSPMAEHLFIVRWLATAQKQKRFPKTVAFDIQLLLDKARKQGMGAKLESHLGYAWRSCSGDLRQQSDLFRLTHAIESLKALGWRNELLEANEWNSGGTGKAPALFVVKALLRQPGPDPRYDRFVQAITADNFTQADVRKIDSNLYRARLCTRDRLLFSFYRYNDETVRLVPECLPNHAYPA